MGVGCSSVIVTHRSFIDSKTKGNPDMRHLDLYARRDPQLAPYLLREVDIEWKRKCRKVNFVMWFALFVGILLYNQRVVSESLFYLRGYAEMVQQQQDAQDDDANVRRARLVSVIQLAKAAFQRDGTWRPEDTKAAVLALRSTEIDASQEVPDRYMK